MDSPPPPPQTLSTFVWRPLPAPPPLADGRRSIYSAGASTATLAFAFVDRHGKWVEITAPNLCDACCEDRPRAEMVFYVRAWHGRQFRAGVCPSCRARHDWAGLGWRDEKEQPASG